MANFIQLITQFSIKCDRGGVLQFELFIYKQWFSYFFKFGCDLGTFSIGLVEIQNFLCFFWDTMQVYNKVIFLRKF